MTRSREVRKLAQKPATSSTDKETTTRFGVLARTRLSAGRCRPAPSNVVRSGIERAFFHLQHFIREQMNGLNDGALVQRPRWRA